MQIYIHGKLNEKCQVKSALSTIRFIKHIFEFCTHNASRCLDFVPVEGIELDVAEYFQCLAGTENNLNHILSTFVESEHEIENFCDSPYIELSDITSIIKDDGKDFTILTLHIQSINLNLTIFIQW